MNKCRICFNQNNSFENYSVLEMMQGKRDAFNYFLCPGCGCLQISDFPKEINIYYDNYYTNERIWDKLPTLQQKLWDFRSFISNYRIYSFIEEISFNSTLNWKSRANLNKTSKILDVGCGSGDILYEFRKHGFYNLTGVDPNLNPNFKYEGIKLFRKSIFEISNKYDFIMFNHSFEHIWEQHDTLEKTRNLLEKNGTILLRLPIINSAFYIYREYWVQIDAPRHFYLHSLESINRLLDKHGLTIYDKYFDSSEFQFMGSEQYKKGIALNADNSYLKNPKKSTFTKRDIRKYKKQAKQFNKEEKGDQVVLFIKKSGEN